MCLFHRWTMWKETLISDVAGKPKEDIESEFIPWFKVYEQIRSCTKCGLVQRKVKKN